MLVNLLHPYGSGPNLDRPRLQAGPGPMIQELTSLGLTEEASLGILKVLMRCGAPQAAIEASEA